MERIAAMVEAINARAPPARWIWWKHRPWTSSGLIMEPGRCHWNEVPIVEALAARFGGASR